MVHRNNRRLLSAGALVLLLSPLAASDASAQGSSYPSSQRNDGPPIQDRDAPPRDYPDDRAALPDGDVPPPRDYDGTRPPPPPPSYQASDYDQRQRDRDDRYASDAERWARDNCVKSQPNTGAGAVIGGIFGAIIGNGLSGRRDRAAGTVAGAAIGALGGAAIANSTGGNETSPGCPPGYVVRRDARAYSYDRDYYYAAPGWYRPWVYVGGYWSYRPYPYHDWYYRTYRPYRGDPYRRGYYRRPGYRYHDRDGRGH